MWTDFNESKVVQYLNAELADTLGNLLNRCTSKAINKYQTFLDLSETELRVSSGDASSLIQSIKSLADVCESHYSEGDFYLGINEIMECLRLNNVFLNETKPWLLVKDSAKEVELQSVLSITLEALRVSAILLQPIIPNISDKVLNKLNVCRSRRQWTDARHVFGHKKSENVFNQQNSVLFAKIK